MSTIKKINGILVPNTFVTGFTYNNSNLLTVSQNGKPDLNVYLNQFSGLTVNGSVSATTYYGDGSNLTGIVSSTDNYVTGGTYSNGTLTLDRQNGSVTITGFTTNGGSVTGAYLPLSGGTVYGNTIFTSGFTANTIQFDTTFTGTVGVGQIAWDSNFGTLQQGLVGGNVIQKIGETSFALVKNVESTTLNKGEVVYIFGATGDKISVKRASNTGDTTSSKTLGVVAENIAANQNGLVITKGTLDGLNLGAYSAGTILWLSSTPGQFTDVKQYAPYHLVFIGVVQRANAGNGQLYVSPQNGYELEEIHDVRITNATEGDLLIRSSYSGSPVWVNSKTLNGNYIISGNTNNIGDFSATTFYGSGLGLNNIPISGVTNLQSNLDLKFDKSGGTVNGNVLVLGNVTILGSATTINTQTLSIADNIITINSNVTGGTPFIGDSGIEVLRGSATTATILWKEQNSQWEAGLQGLTKRILLQGDSLALLTSGHTHPISEVNGLQTALNNKFDSSGGTITGNVLVTGSVSATTFYGNGQYLTGINDFYVTGGTFSGTTLTLNRQNGSITITGFTSGGGSGVDTYVTGFTYSNNNITLSQNQGQSAITVNISTMTGLTVNGILSASTWNTPIPNTQVVYSNNGTLTGSTNLTWTNSSALLTINGTLEATSKSFSIPHPTKEGKKLVYGSLEGPENGVYHRGKLYNEDTIVLPEYWYKLVDKNTVTVHLTPIGKHQNLYVKEIFEDKVIIGIEGGLFSNKTINCYYVVYGERKDINKLEVER